MVKLDGYSPEYFGLLFLKDHYHPATPEMRNRTMTIPGMPGEWDFGSEWGSRPFNLPFAVIEYDRYELQRKLRAFVAFLMDAYGTPREIKLSFDYEPDKYYSVKLNAKIDPQRLFSTAEFAIPFIANSPQAKFIVPTDEISMDSEVPVLSDITIGAEYQFNIGSNQIITIINDGTLAVKPTILITGTAKDFSLTLSGETYSFGAVSSPIEIQAENYLVKVNGVSSLSAMTGAIEKLILQPGENTFSITGTSMNLKITFKFNHQYI